MYSLVDQKRYRADTGGPSNARDRRSCLSNDVLVKYERFTSYERNMHQYGRSIATYRGEVTGGSPLRSLPQGIMAGVRRLYLEPRG
ncbi:hypothetical protein ACOSQ3_031662 [Xanthoceras sorbifolium]